MLEEEKEIRKLWVYSDPETSRKRFEDMKKDKFPHTDDQFHLILITQIARSFSLERKFDEGHQLLDQYMVQFEKSNPRVKTYYNLERGRLYNSSGKTEEALTRFYRAWDLAKTAGLDFLAVDSAHMIAIADPENSLEWNNTAIDYVENSKCETAKSWLGPLYNNQGWNYHDLGNFEKALELFQKAKQFHDQYGNEHSQRIAKWTIGRVYRSLSQIDQAFEIMQELEQNAIKEDRPVGPYVLEELGELYLIKQKEGKYQTYFKQAYQVLSEDKYFVKNYPDRLKRIKSLAGL